MKRITITYLFFIGSICCNAQAGRDSCSMQISLLTCAPGSDLYSLFGHTAIRILDTARGMDIVYNYGTFDDTDPLFYIHFTRGIMRYSLSAETFQDFMAEYEFEHRAVVSQILNLSCREKNQLYEALRKNTLDENRFYQYHFHTDNCTTRAARMIETNTEGALIYKNILPDPGRSYRDMIHEYLDRQKQYWSEFGIDMLLGMNLDKKPGNIEAIHFLPDYLLNGLDNANEANKPVVAAKQIILLPFPVTNPKAAFLTPSVVFIILLLISICLYFLRGKPAAVNALLIFDIVFFSLLGLIGVVMAYTWLGRVDNVCRDNINILWALPTHLIAIFFIRKKITLVKYYFLFSAAVATVLLLGFPWWSQRMNTGVLPLLAIIIFRSIHLSKNRSHEKKPVIPG
jgi:hypothetical protein